MKTIPITPTREEIRAHAMEPLVALSAQTETDPLSYGIRRRYADYLQAAGAMAVIIPPNADASALAATLKRCDGLMVPGGPDICPSLYGAAEPKGAPVGTYHLLRDESELALMRCAFELGMPLLAICRGFQLLNVAFGGTLHEDIRAHGGEAHWLEDENEDPILPAHQAELAAEGPLFEALGAGPIAVNSMHHQAIERVGAGLREAARGPAANLPDHGETPVIEALFHPERDFFLGVQWHPEYGLDDGPSMALARAFTAACKRYRDLRKARR